LTCFFQEERRENRLTPGPDGVNGYALRVAAFMDVTNACNSASICSGLSTFFSMIFTIAEPEMAPAAFASIAAVT